MIFNRDASHLSEEEWNRTAGHLKPLVGEFLLIAKRLDLSFRCSERWPMLVLSRKNLRRTAEFRFSLNSNYMQDGRVFFELIHQQFTRNWLAKPEVATSRAIADYQLEDLRDIRFLVSSIEERIAVELEKGSF